MSLFQAEASRGLATFTPVTLGTLLPLDKPGLACGRMRDLVKKVPHYLTCEQDHPGPASPPPACRRTTDVREGRAAELTTDM